MAPPGTDTGPPINGRPPEQPQALTDHVANGSAENRQSRERLMSSKVNEDGGEAGGVSTLSSSRKNSMERRARRDSEKEKADEALQSILQSCRTAEIGSNLHIVQIRIDQENQNKRVAEMALALDAMKLQMDQLLVMGQQAEQTKDLVENLKKGEVTLNDTKGLQDGIVGCFLRLKEEVLQSI